jgi:hypothetical protein
MPTIRSRDADDDPAVDRPAEPPRAEHGQNAAGEDVALPDDTGRDDRTGAEREAADFGGE